MIRNILGPCRPLWQWTLSARHVRRCRSDVLSFAPVPDLVGPARPTLSVRRALVCSCFRPCRPGTPDVVGQTCPRLLRTLSARHVGRCRPDVLSFVPVSDLVGPARPTLSAKRALVCSCFRPCRPGTSDVVGQTCPRLFRTLSARHARCCRPDVPSFVPSPDPLVELWGPPSNG